MIKINVYTDFTSTPGFRTYEDGPFSGQEFFDSLLKPKFKEALDSNQIVEINLNGVEGYTSSFINESFRLLGKEFGADNVWKRLVIVTDEMPKLKEKIKNSIYEE